MEWNTLLLNVCHNLLHQVLTYYDEYLHLMQRAKMEVMWVLSIVSGEHKNGCIEMRKNINTRENERIRKTKQN